MILKIINYNVLSFLSHFPDASLRYHISVSTPLLSTGDSYLFFDNHFVHSLGFSVPLLPFCLILFSLTISFVVNDSSFSFCLHNSPWVYVIPLCHHLTFFIVSTDHISYIYPCFFACPFRSVSYRVCPSSTIAVSALTGECFTLGKWVCQWGAEFILQPP
jgi:hypothetical protein